MAFLNIACPLLLHEHSKGHGTLEAPQTFPGRVPDGQGKGKRLACSDREDCGCHRCATQWKGRLLFYEYYTHFAKGLEPFVADVLGDLDSWLPPEYRSCGRLYVAVWGRVDTRFLVNDRGVWVYRFFVVLPCEVTWRRLWEKPLRADRRPLIPALVDSGARIHMDVHSLPSGSSLDETREFLQYGLDLIQSSRYNGGVGGYPMSFTFGDSRRFKEMCRKHMGLSVGDISQELPPSYPD